MMSFLHAFHDPLDWYLHVFVWTEPQNYIVWLYMKFLIVYFSQSFCYICL